MANFKNIPTKYLAGGILALVVILLAVTLIQPSNFLFKDKTDYEKQQEQAAAEQKEYAEYLASIKPDPEASLRLYQNVIDPVEVEKAVALELNTAQKVAIPTIPDSKIVLASRSDKDAVVNYFVSVGKMINDFNTQVSPTTRELFDQGATPADYTAGLATTAALVDKMYQTPVPAEAVGFHKAELVAMDNLRGLIGQAQNYAGGAESNPWPGVYASHTIINSGQSTAEAEFKKLDGKYNLAQITVSDVPLAAQLGLVKEAQAQFAVADFPQTARYIYDQALGAAFSNFFSVFLESFIGQLESNYKISNFLYYTDALITGQYLNDYLTKYVPDPLDRSLIRRFVPQVSCAGNQENLEPIFQAKAREFFNPNTLNPTDANFYEQLARGGQVSFSTPTGQKSLFEQYASGALSQAHDAAMTELTESQGGLKVSRNTTTNVIESTITSIKGSLQSAIEGRLNLGAYDPQSIVSKIVSQGLTEFEKKFIFKGAVLKEQSTCIPFPQLQPVIPGSFPDYDAPNPIIFGF